MITIYYHAYRGYLLFNRKLFPGLKSSEGSFSRGTWFRLKSSILHRLPATTRPTWSWHPSYSLQPSGKLGVKRFLYRVHQLEPSQPVAPRKFDCSQPLACEIRYSYAL